MATLGGKEERRNERTKSLPHPSKRSTQRWWRNLTKEVEINQKEKRKEKESFSQEREESSPRVP
jgi:hypothetical protein